MVTGTRLADITVFQAARPPTMILKGTQQEKVKLNIPPTHTGGDEVEGWGERKAETEQRLTFPLLVSQYLGSRGAPYLRPVMKFMARARRQRCDSRVSLSLTVCGSQSPYCAHCFWSNNPQRSRLGLMEPLIVPGLNFFFQ